MGRFILIPTIATSSFPWAGRYMPSQLGIQTNDEGTKSPMISVEEAVRSGASARILAQAFLTESTHRFPIYISP